MRSIQEEQVGPQERQLYGVAGWLGFFVFTSLTIGPVMGFGRVWTRFASAESQNPALTFLVDWGTYKFWTWISVALILGAGMWLTLRLATHYQPSSVQWIKTYMLSAPLVSVFADVFIASAVFGNYPIEAAMPTVASSIVPAYLAAGIWFWYFSVSRRVKNTYYTPRRRAETSSAETGETPRAEPILAATYSPHGAEEPSSLEGKLLRLRGMRDSGLISDSEYAKKKQDLLSRL